MNSRNVKGILLSLSLCLAVFAALVTVGLTLIRASSVEMHRLETAKFESPKSTLLAILFQAAEFQWETIQVEHKV